MKSNIVQVDENGVDASGEDYHMVASPEEVDRGHMVNIPTLIQYPNGTIAMGNLLQFTAAGIDWLRQNMSTGHISGEGA